MSVKSTLFGYLWKAEALEKKDGEMEEEGVQELIWEEFEKDDEFLEVVNVLESVLKMESGQLKGDGDGTRKKIMDMINVLRNNEFIVTEKLDRCGRIKKNKIGSKSDEELDGSLVEIDENEQEDDQIKEMFLSKTKDTQEKISNLWSKIKGRLKEGLDKDENGDSEQIISQDL